MSTPDYVICLECESPIYAFEWDGARVKEAVCPTCGNDQPGLFSTEEEIEEMSALNESTFGRNES
jgi:translation initiation factor 2 beta subunit (eIF-2beta)/eIF-5